MARDDEFWIGVENWCRTFGFEKGETVKGPSGLAYVVDNFATDGMRVAIFLHDPNNPAITAVVYIPFVDPQWREDVIVRRR